MNLSAWDPAREGREIEGHVRDRDCSHPRVARVERTPALGPPARARDLAAQSLTIDLLDE